jgi:hypothetical protein
MKNRLPLGGILSSVVRLRIGEDHRLSSTYHGVAYRVGIPHRVLPLIVVGRELVIHAAENDHSIWSENVRRHVVERGHRRNAARHLRKHRLQILALRDDATNAGEGAELPLVTLRAREAEAALNDQLECRPRSREERQRLWRQSVRPGALHNQHLPHTVRKWKLARYVVVRTSHGSFAEPDDAVAYEFEAARFAH